MHKSDYDRKIICLQKKPAAAAGGGGGAAKGGDKKAAGGDKPAGKKGLWKLSFQP